MSSKDDYDALISKLVREVDARMEDIRRTVQSIVDIKEQRQQEAYDNDEGAGTV